MSAEEPRISSGTRPVEARGPSARQWKTLDSDLGRINLLEEAASVVARPLVAPGLALVFFILVLLLAGIVGNWGDQHLLVIAASVIGAYTALNIGANDVANNMGPAVGSRALSMGGALAIAAICEAAGALLAGDRVVDTIARGIVTPDAAMPPGDFIRLMLSALIATALWINLATWLRVPVSTTHSVVGGVTGAGLAAAGIAAIHWGSLGWITASWIISPFVGGLLAALVLAFLHRHILYVDDKLAAACRWVPVMTGLMAAAFAAYLPLIGLENRLHPGHLAPPLLALICGLVAWAVSRPVIRNRAAGLENRRKSLRQLFAVPLVIAAGLLSFAHGANDVANAVGPVAAIVDMVQQHPGAAPGALVALPGWITLIGALGIAVGVILFGPRLITMVGSEITRLSPARAYCIALATAITVILASAAGLPVSTTQIAVGSVFGVGFFREWDAARRARSKATREGKLVPPEERQRRRLVRRSHLISISAAWVVTMPATATIAAVLFALLGLFAR